MENHVPAKQKNSCWETGILKSFAKYWPIRHPANFTTKSIYLVHQLWLCRTSYSRITWLLIRTTISRMSHSSLNNSAELGLGLDNKQYRAKWKDFPLAHYRLTIQKCTKSVKTLALCLFQSCAGEQTCQAMRSRFSVSNRVRAPMRAAASAASHPACPPPTTTTSYLSSSSVEEKWETPFPAKAAEAEEEEEALQHILVPTLVIVLPDLLHNCTFLNSLFQENAWLLNGVSECCKTEEEILELFFPLHLWNWATTDGNRSNHEADGNLARIGWCMERGGGGGQVQQGFDESARAGRGDFSEESDVTLTLAIAKRAC